MFDLDIFFDETVEIKDLFENLETSFKFSLNINPNLGYEMNKVYLRTLNNYARFILGGFQLTLFKKAEDIVRFNEDEGSVDLIKRFTDYIGVFFDEIYLKLYVEDAEDINQLKYILSLSLLLLKDALDENNVELAFESFYQLESRLKRHFTLKKNFIYDSKTPYYIKYDDVENDNIVIIEADNYVL